MTIENPQSFIVSQECQKVTWKCGFRRPLGVADGWARFGSTTANGSVYLAATGKHGPWYLAIDHAGVVEEVGLSGTELAGPGIARYAFPNLGELYAAMPRVYQLSASLPDAPFREFQSQTQNLPKTTEAERLVVQRIGQDIFRAGLMDYWQGRCPLTGIADPDLLRASHIVPWKDCQSDSDRLDVHNGLLLSALWDAAFDRGLVTFDDGGHPQFSNALSDIARSELRWQAPIALTEKHKKRLAWHRASCFGVKSA
jgi:hypothetical protein